MNCKELQENLMDLAEGKIAGSQQESMHQHIQDCANCSAAFAEIKYGFSLIEKEKQLEPNAWLQEKVINKLRAKQEKKSEIHYGRAVFRLAFVLAFGITAGILLNNFLNDSSAEEKNQDNIAQTSSDDLLGNDNTILSLNE